MFAFLKKNWKRFLGVVVLIVLVIIIVKGKGEEVLTTYTVSRQDVSDILVLSGKVEPVDRVEMAFAGSGVIDRVFKQNGDTVRAGEKIVELDNASLLANLAEAEASLKLQIAETTIGDAEIENDISNAYANLLSDDLVAYSKDPDNIFSPPTVSGRYIMGKEGQYRIKIDFSGSASRKSFVYSGLEKGEQAIVFYKPVPLGESGLYLQFNEEDTEVGDVWLIDIPNVGGDSYVENLNVYKTALTARNGDNSENISQSISLEKVNQAKANIAKIKADIEERTLRAPFDGVVSKVDAKKGEIAGAGEIVATIISKDKYRVKVQVPEVDIVNLLPGLTAEIMLDAYGKGVVFPAKVMSVDQSETKVDGVSVYEADVLFDQTDPRILSGLSANVSILKNKKESVLCVPARFIDKDDAQEFVLVQNLANETSDKTFVTTGLRGSDGCIEILSGLDESDVVVGNFEK